MRRKRYSEEQVIGVLRYADAIAQPKELDKADLKDLLGPKWQAPQAKGHAVDMLRHERPLEITRACGPTGSV